jgi:hypothetical protein
MFGGETETESMLGTVPQRSSRRSRFEYDYDWTGCMFTGRARFAW